MEGIATVLGRILSTSASDGEGRECIYCKTFIPVLEVDVLGRASKVQPVCECEARKCDEERIEFENRQKRLDIQKLFSISDVGSRFHETTFENYILRDGTERAYQVAKKYTDEFPDWKSDALLIWGVPGNGKTHLASAITNALNKKGYAVVFQSVPELLERIRSTFNKENKESEAKVMEALLTCDLLILDDIGAEKISDWVQDVIFRIVDGRYRKLKPIIYTTNLQPKELADKIGPRSYDRIVETSLMIENKSQSFRREKAKERLANLNL